MRMSTPTEYVQATNNNNATLPEYDSDFFPMVGKEKDVWSGYFSSRPGFKAQVRHVSE